MNGQYCVYLSFKPYVREWLTHKYGDPVVFPAKSKEHAELLYQVQRMPPGEIPHMRKPNEVAIVIPSTARQKAQYYNWLTPVAREALISMVNTSFDRDLKVKVCASIEHGVGVKFAIRAYMHTNGIDVEYEGTLKQRINRMRNADNWKRVNTSKMQEND